MSQDEIAVMDGGKCMMQLRGVRPFFSDKFDITKHSRYKELSDYDPKNTFDIEDYVKHLQHMKVTPNTEVDEAFDCGEVSGQEDNSPTTTKQRLLDIVSRSAKRQLNMELVNLWHKAKIRSFVCTLGTDKTGHPAQPIAKQNVADARTGFS